MREGGVVLDYMDRLRRLAINDEQLAEECASGGAELAELDLKTLTLVRLAALVAVGGATSSFSAQSDAAIGAGATPAEMVDVLLGVLSVVGLPRAVAAAPHLAMALGYDIDAAL
jgi:4-carboxymuconolactone decarboxylase